LLYDFDKIKGGSVTVQVSQIQSPEPRLFEDSSIQNNSDNSFRTYLDEEQKRLAQLFVPLSGFNFSSWFEYASPFKQTEATSNSTKMFADIELFPPENTVAKPANNQTKSLNQPAAPNQSVQESLTYFATKPSQNFLQNLLAETGWLTPNIEALPLFNQAQLGGKLLSKLDLQYLVDQIISQLKIVKDKGKTELVLGLKPENLGEILLTLTSRAGMISIEIQAAEETKKLIVAEREKLELALKKAKINLNDLKITTIKEENQHV